VSDSGKGKSSPELETMPQSAVSWNMEPTLDKLGGDEKLLQEIVAIFLDEAPRHLAILRQALETGNAEGIERAAHSLKGELGYLCVPKLSQAACDLEEKGRNSDLEGVSMLLPGLAAGVSNLLDSIRDAKIMALEDKPLTEQIGASRS
jgi:HPt (histidine-containing phosphotransfer) domain-containing protein